MRLIRLGLVVAFLAAAAFFVLPKLLPLASASCPDVEVVFARGTDEPPGVGQVGQAFVGSLRQHTRKSVGSYGVNYPANKDFLAAADGANDASNHIQQMANNCPNTKIVLGGYSQGAAVIDIVTAAPLPGLGFHQPLPADAANHVAAVALFGKPSTQFMSIINEPPVTVGPLYEPKTIELCVPNDPVCSGTGFPAAHRQYVEAGMVDQAADFAAGRI